MSDLISRSAVIDVLKETGIIQDNDLGYLVVGEVERIPTAYDLEQVVKELGNYSMWKEFMIYELTHREREIIARAIEIVKGGGANE